ncbi:MAG: NTP transferase domain-containing protein [Muribaculaceae bacterium]|nr:NTP transferase domain-containing protein [Muribaculaceae bacterium]
MIGIVFAAGIGSRLKPFTDFHPKALAPIGSKPAMELVLDKMEQCGIGDIIVNVHHFADQVENFVSRRESAAHIHISDERARLLDTGGALVKMYRENPLFRNMSEDEIIVVHNADIVTDFPLKELAEFAASVDAAILVNPQRTTTRHFLFDDKGLLQGWNNTATGSVRPSGLATAGLTPAAFGGVHAIHLRTLRALDKYCGAELRPFSITDFYIDTCREMRTGAFIPAQAYRWHDIGTPEKLSAAQADFC